MYVNHLVGFDVSVTSSCLLTTGLGMFVLWVLRMINGLCWAYVIPNMYAKSKVLYKFWMSNSA